MESFADIFEKICRVCGVPCSDHMVSLFEDDGKNLSCYGKAISTFTNVIITQNDNLPKKMCPNCLYQLRQAILFKIKCERNHMIFRILISNNLNDINQEMAEKNIVEYIMFKKYFPNTDSKFSIPSSKSKLQNMKLKSNFGIKKVKCERNIPNFLDTNTAADYTDNDVVEIKLEKECKIKRNGKNKKIIKKNKTSKSTRIKVANKKYECEICHKVLANKPTYEVHKWRHAGGRYICEHCGKGYATNYELDIHKVHSHGTGRYFQCKTCNFKAANRFSLTEHERLHTGERPFACEKCGLTFRRRFIWNKHLLLHNEKTLQCTQCPRRFHRKSDLSAHCNNVHQRRYLFACQYCGTSYAKGSSMRKHYVEKHNVKREEQGRLVKVIIGANVDQSTQGTTEE